MGVVIAPHVTEKASLASGRGWYAFRVRADANKIIVKRAVEDRYGVTVERVRILRRRPKRIRLGRIEGRTPGFKKAMVKVKAGQTIELT
ncbi:MAG: 50S ribosomal protein L23 [Candidatus Sungbacteria bacterium RIFCSPLOWO2_01_FULL_59_16]|uniref:Large ribosomal subunit protein uL23 n=1 Tax=Candidatus Sungbacteria bacterium RIFCSPLOWO2_01_FULL_59_16 TaxID=1802280 RepID=A0A1G2LBI1_9BACT|nr:MAG: 50S ribosomal protein L23 [Candidatus Sungbacteria bacterium RIFCSPLOWO2_01_FULL_59_16]